MPVLSVRRIGSQLPVDLAKFRVDTLGEVLSTPHSEEDCVEVVWGSLSQLLKLDVLLVLQFDISLLVHDGLARKSQAVKLQELVHLGNHVLPDLVKDNGNDSASSF